MFENSVSFKTECFNCGDKGEYHIDVACNIITLPKHWLFVKRNDKNIIVCSNFCVKNLINVLDENKP